MNNRYFTVTLMSLLTIMPFTKAMDQDDWGKPITEHPILCCGLVAAGAATGAWLLWRLYKIPKRKMQKKKIDYNKELLQVAQSEANSNTITRVKELLQLGANVNTEDKKGWTPLLHAGLTAYNPKLIKCLLEEGANPRQAFYPFALAGFHALITPFILYVPTSYLNALSNKSMEVHTEAHEYATKKINVLKFLCSARFKDNKTLAQKIAETKIPGKKQITAPQLVVIDMLDPENCEQHRQDIVIEFKRRLFGN